MGPSREMTVCTANGAQLPIDGPQLPHLAYGVLNEVDAGSLKEKAVKRESKARF